jgi:hypothetical protein
MAGSWDLDCQQCSISPPGNNIIFHVTKALEFKETNKHRHSLQGDKIHRVARKSGQGIHFINTEL